MHNKQLENLQEIKEVLKQIKFPLRNQYGENDYIAMGMLLNQYGIDLYLEALKQAQDRIVELETEVERLRV